MLAAGGITQTVVDGPLLIAGALALAAGAVSFASPCVLPLVPGYLSYLVGLVGSEQTAGGSRPSGTGTRTDTATKTTRSAAVRGAALFVAGFTVVFMAISVLILGLRNLVLDNQSLLLRIGGVITVIMGMAMLGWVRPLQREARIHSRPTGRYLGALLLGGFFALGWVVCIGPTYLGVQSLAISMEWNGALWRGLLLTLLYCLGLGVPFLLLAFGFGWATAAVGFLRRHSRTIQIIGAVALIVIGLLMVSGTWESFIRWLQNRFASTETVL
ncbi:cytochrome c biogenesis protein CcdA [Nakamurella sp. DB0629]|uniref:Cytochrome c biogenesis protein CcdA n=2 Tax=Nakamurella aerolata TaxID=1656892 RepID=A0A849A346_9ACTN|nr:cytochrome c biogenesis CcdA family protein [Nakamurella aerolata]NNG35029.1 cytochrome c biogenesis protein CcdA [Nakamurella aerolata]